MKYILPFITIFIFSCSNSFINHKLEYKKRGDCREATPAISIVSNINGERYEFQECINDNFNGKDYTVTRSGDSIMVNFPTNGATQSLFSFTMDIDAKPAYHHIFFNGREVKIGAAKNF